jgi:cyclase
MKQLTLLFCVVFLSMPGRAESRFDKIEITTVPVQAGIYMLIGSGGNIGVSIGDDGLLIVDSQYAPLSAKIKSALSELAQGSPAFLLNTHYHGDHTGGNVNFGAETLIVAHENVKARLLSEDSPGISLPGITFKQEVSVYFNAEEIRLVHMPAGHTDGDSIVFFTGSNVVHMGDHYFKDRFPYVDLDAGGTVDGLIVNIGKALAEIREDTGVIPGHGPLANKADLQNYFVMLVETSKAVKSQINDGKSIDQILQQGLDDRWDSWAAGFISEERWIQTLYKNYSEG